MNPLALDDIPRVDRGVVWARAEELQRLSPTLTASTVMFQAMREYEDKGDPGAAHERLIEAVRDNPAILFR